MDSTFSSGACTLVMFAMRRLIPCTRSNFPNLHPSDRRFSRNSARSKGVLENAAARTHLVEDSKLVADGALGDLGEGDNEGADVAVQLQAAKLVEALHPQRCLHPLHHLPMTSLYLSIAI